MLLDDELAVTDELLPADDLALDAALLATEDLLLAATLLAADDLALLTAEDLLLDEEAVAGLYEHVALSGNEFAGYALLTHENSPVFVA